MQDQFKNPYSFRGEIYFEKGWGSLIQKKENIRTHTDSSRKLSFADLVNTFESKINSSIVKNPLTSTSRLVLSTPTKRGRGVIGEENFKTDVICTKSFPHNVPKLSQTGVGGSESRAKRRRCELSSEGDVTIRNGGARKTGFGD